MLASLLIAYLALLLVIAAFVRLRHGHQRDGHTHFVAGGRLSAFITACSLTATSVGGSSIVVASSLVYQHGLAGIWMDLAGALGFLALGLFLARRVRQTGVASIAELAGLRYGGGVRRLVALLVLFAELAWLALQAKATAAVLGPSLPCFAQWHIVAGSLGLVAVYTLLGGQYAVSYIDVAQLGVMLLGLGVIAPIAALRAVGVEHLASLDWQFPTSASFGPWDIFGYLVLIGLPHAVGSDIYAKILSARDGRAAARGAILAVLLKVVFAVAIAVSALCAARLLPGLGNPGELLGTFIQRVLPSSVSSIVILAVIATMQSTASQVLLSAVTMVGNDLWPRPTIVPISTVIFGLTAFVLAIAFPTVIDLMKVAYTVFAAGLSLPVTISLFPSITVPRPAVAAAMAAGGLLGGGLHITRLLGAPVHGEPVLWGVASSALCLLAGALLRRRERQEAIDQGHKM